MNNLVGLEIKNLIIFFLSLPQNSFLIIFFFSSIFFCMSALVSTPHYVIKHHRIIMSDKIFILYFGLIEKNVH